MLESKYGVGPLQKRASLRYSGPIKAGVRMTALLRCAGTAPTSYLEPHVAPDLRNLGTATSASTTANLSRREGEALCAFFLLWRRVMMCWRLLQEGASQRRGWARWR